MERRYFTNGVRTEPAYTPADAVKYRHDGWRECGAPVSADSTDENSTADADDDSSTDRKDELPNGTIDD